METQTSNKLKKNYCSLSDFLSIPKEITGEDIKTMDEHRGCMEIKKMWEYRFGIVTIETEKLINCSELSDNALLWIIVHMREKFNRMQEKLTFIEQMMHDTDPECRLRR
jgi:hypothetical protein